eukprot:TRINITY_DN2891_c1_g1_i3.p1 TRINITY_DN2891_c1_g1~~TRINITY_DN2891_c1_g1_i3.p1  ORF type:complete len:429 (+),score=147.75 TRINITY_DN2891_c1_g1_i3:1633-2919(+)
MIHTPPAPAAPTQQCTWWAPDAGQPANPQTLQEKLAVAATDILACVQETRGCSELQHDLERAVATGVDCSEFFRQVEHILPQLIVHPAGNYLVSKCFDLCPGLIDLAAEFVTRHLRLYALHKHASYVVEAIIEHACGAPEARAGIISELISPWNRRAVAAHDSGNFVMQKAIDHCPDDLLPLMVDAVQEIISSCPHGNKMQKKLQQRLNRSPQYSNMRPLRRTPVQTPMYQAPPPVMAPRADQWFDLPPHPAQHPTGMCVGPRPSWTPVPQPWGMAAPPCRMGYEYPPQVYDYCQQHPVYMTSRPPAQGAATQSCLRTPFQPDCGADGRMEQTPQQPQQQLVTPVHQPPVEPSSAVFSSTPSSSTSGRGPVQTADAPPTPPAAPFTPQFGPADSMGSWADVTDAEEEAQEMMSERRQIPSIQTGAALG